MNRENLETIESDEDDGILQVSDLSLLDALVLLGGFKFPGSDTNHKSKICKEQKVDKKRRSQLRMGLSRGNARIS